MIPRTQVVSRRENAFWKAYRVLLGFNTGFRHRSIVPDIEAEERYVSVRYGRFGITSYVAGPSRGKSVMWKRMIDQALLIRPGRAAIIFDAQGVDGVLMKHPSEGGLIFDSVGEYRVGHDRVVGFTPYFLRGDRNLDDYVFKIPWSALEMDEFEFLLSQASDARSWIAQFKFVLRKHKELVRQKGLRWLLAEYERRVEDEKYVSIVVPRMMGKLEVFSIARALADIVERGYLSEDGDPYNIDIVKVMESGVIPVINLHLDRDVPAKLYVGVMLRQIYQYYDRRRRALEAVGKEPLGPLIVFEEFSQLAPKRELGQSMTPVEMWVARVIKQGMKLRFDLHLVVQDTMDIAPEIRRSIFGQRIVMSNPSPEDQAVLARKFGPWIVELVQHLDQHPSDWGAYEWLVVDFGVPMTFRPGASLSKFHRR